MKNLFVILFCILFLSACSVVPDSSRSILEEQGYTDVEITGVNLFSCSDDDMFRYNFTALNSNGKHIKGVVCSAPFKGYTIRYFR